MRSLPVLLACLATPLASQGVVQELPGDLVLALGDLSDDGLPDLVLTGATVDATYLRAYSALDRTLLWTSDGAGTTPHRLIAIGDVTGDGLQDFAVDRGADYDLRSGADGSLVRTLNSTLLGDHALVGPGDLDGDGRADVVVGRPALEVECATGATSFSPDEPTSSIVALSGFDGSELWRRTFARGSGGVLGNVGDVNGDGAGDVLASFHTRPTPTEDGGTCVAGPRSFALFSGRNGDILHLSPGRVALATCALDDLDGDGRPEFAVATEDQVTVYTGPDLGLLTAVWSSDSPAGDQRGYTLAAVDDVDGDGLRDLLVGAAQRPERDPVSGVLADAGPGYVELCSGATGELVRRLQGIDVGGDYGAQLDVLGDVNGDGRPEILVGSPGLRIPGLPVGTVRVATLEPSVLNADRLLIEPTTGGQVRFEFDAGPERAGCVYLVLGSTGIETGTSLFGADLPLDFDDYFLRSLGAANPLLEASAGFLDADGRGATVLTLPPLPNPALAGLELHHAVTVLEFFPLTFTFVSNVLPVRLLAEPEPEPDPDDEPDDDPGGDSGSEP